MGIPHIHADVIKAWADGADIEFFSTNHQIWKPVPNPCWIEGVVYRVKQDWYDNIPENGILCKIVDDYEDDVFYAVITSSGLHTNTTRWYKTQCCCVYHEGSYTVTPLTQEEFDQIKYQDN